MFKKLMEKMQYEYVKLQNEDGQGLVEYALILVLISIVCIVALTAIGTNANTVFNQIKDKLVPAGGS